jgi:hypothetical protein
MKRILILLSIIIILVLAAWYGVVTESRVVKLTNRFLYPYGFSCEIKGFKNLIPFNLHIDRFVLKPRPEFVYKGQNKTLTYLFKQQRTKGLSVDDIALRLKPFNLSLKFSSDIFKGYLTGQFGLFKDLLVQIKDIDIEPVGQMFDVEISGRLNGEFVSNKLQFWLRDANLVDIALNNHFLPLGLISDIKSTLIIKGGLIEIDHIYLVGKEGKARIKGGMLSRDGIDLTVVFMPADDTIWSLVLKKYRIKKRVYQIPVKRRWSSRK